MIGTAKPLKVGYLISRFPTASETFVVREMDAVIAAADIDIALLALFPARDRFLHQIAEPWLERLSRPSVLTGLVSLAGWLLRRPARTAGAVRHVVASTWRQPRLLLESLVTLAVAAAHARRVERDGIDHLHAHFAAYPALAAWFCGRLCGVPYSFTAHAYDIFVDQRMLATKVAEAEFVATVSAYNKRFLRDYGGDDASPVEIVHCGVDPDAYPFRPRQVPPEGEVRALCVASLQEKKGHRVLLEALAADGPGLARLSLDLVGGGPLREPLERDVERFGLAGRVRFHGARTEHEVREMLARADVFVLPSIVASDGQMEGLPVALIEALASGVPTVATRMSGIPELIEDGRTGLLAEPGDAASLAIALRRALDGEPLDTASGRELVESAFDVRDSGARMAGLLRAAHA